MDTLLKPKITDPSTDFTVTNDAPVTPYVTKEGWVVDRNSGDWIRDDSGNTDEKKGTPITGAGPATVVDDEGNVVNDNGGSTVTVGTPVGQEPSDPPSFPFDLDSLLSTIEGIQGQLFNADGMLNTAQQIGEFLKQMQQYFTKFPKVTDGDALNLAQSVYNTISTYMSNYLNLLYDRQNWVFQQEYNNPLNQIRRFMQAGINPAFYFGSLGNSNAGEIGNSQQQGGQMNSQVQSGNPTLAAVEQAVGVATNLVGAGMGVANTCSTLNYNRAQIDNMKKLQPAQLESLYAGAFAQEQAGEFSKANIGFQKILTDCATEQNQIAWANLKQAWDIFNIANDTSLDIANIGANATMGAAALGANATMGAASMSFQANEQSNRVAGYKAVIDEYYEEVTELGWVENDTGEIITSESEEYDNISATLNLKAGIDIPGGSVEGGGSIGSSEGSTLKEGQTTTYNNKKYTSKQVSYGRIKDYEKFMKAIRAVDGLVKTGSSDKAFNHYMAKGMHVVDKQQRKTLMGVAKDFALYCLTAGKRGSSPF